MFDLQADDGSIRKRAYKSPIPGDTGKEATRPRAGNRLDKPDMVEMHKRLLDLHTREIDRQNDNRIEQAIDEDFYDNIQWTEADAATLRDRGQMPLVYNVISSSIDWVLGSEKRARADFKVLPRRKEQGKPAQRKTELLKYLSDVNRSPFHTSRAFEDCVKVGIGWLEDGIQDEDDDEPIYTRYESWRNILWDSAATTLDLSDARFVNRSKWVDLDIAKAMFPKRKALLDRAASDATNFVALDQYGDEAMDQQELELDRAGGSTSSDRVGGYQRRRVRLIESWIRIPVQTEKIANGEFRGEIFDEYSPAHREQIDTGQAEKREKLTMRMHVAIFTSAGMLYFGPSPYRHNRFPLTPIWAYKRGRDGLPYGMIRRLKDIQTDINKRASKALHILSTSKVIMDEGAVEDIDEFRNEIARPDAIIVRKQGKQIDINADRDLAQWHLELMSRSISLIQSTSGVTDENLGRQSNATSGIAIQRRQDQGALATAKIFDNLRFAKQCQGEKQLSLIEQFMSEPKQFRITNQRGAPEYVEVNDGLPENDIVRSKADYVISEADWRASMRQAAADELMEVMAKLPPEVSLVLLDLVVENMDLPNNEEIVKRIRGLTGQKDPDAEESSPEDLAREQAAAAQQKMQQEMMMADLRKKIADAAKTEQQAKQIQAQTVGSQVDSQVKALGAATQALALPSGAHVADHILDQSGFVSKDDETMAMAAAEQAQSQPGLMQGAQPLPDSQPQPGIAPVPPQPQPQGQPNGPEA